MELENGNSLHPPTADILVIMGIRKVARLESMARGKWQLKIDEGIAKGMYEKVSRNCIFNTKDWKGHKTAY